MIKIYVNRSFEKWRHANRITNLQLIKLTKEMEQGLFDANLGGGLYKKRIARQDAGKRDSFRSLVIFKNNEKIIFVYGFSKNEKENITQKEKAVFRALAKYYLSASMEQFKSLIKNKVLFEVNENE